MSNKVKITDIIDNIFLDTKSLPNDDGLTRSISEVPKENYFEIDSKRYGISKPKRNVIKGVILHDKN